MKEVQVVSIRVIRVIGVIRVMRVIRVIRVIRFIRVILDAYGPPVDLLRTPFGPRWLLNLTGVGARQGHPGPSPVCRV